MYHQNTGDGPRHTSVETSLDTREQSSTHYVERVFMINYLRIENAEGYVLIAIYLFVCVLLA